MTSFKCFSFHICFSPNHGVSGSQKLLFYPIDSSHVIFSDLNNQAQHLSLDFYQTAEPKRHDAEESSTDEEMKEPVNKSPLQLSDSEV